MASGGKMFAEHGIKFWKKRPQNLERKKIKALKIERQVEYKIFAHVKDTIFGEN